MLKIFDEERGDDVYVRLISSENRDSLDLIVCDRDGIIEYRILNISQNGIVRYDNVCEDYFLIGENGRIRDIL